MYTLEDVLQPVAEGDLSAAAFFDDFPDNSHNLEPGNHFALLLSHL